MGIGYVNNLCIVEFNNRIKIILWYLFVYSNKLFVCCNTHTTFI